MNESWKCCAINVPALLLRNIYCIGDNVCTDIFGANLYNKYLERRAADSTYFTQKAQVSGQA